MRTYLLTPHESVTVVDHSPERLLVDIRYEPDGLTPPAHLHPDQDEAFEVVSGTIGVRLAGSTRVLIPGDLITIPRGTPHTMWNAGAEPARARWALAPAGRTVEWFSLLDRYQRVNGRTPGLATFASWLRAYPDVFRLAGPAVLLRPLLAFLGAFAPTAPTRPISRMSTARPGSGRFSGWSAGLRRDRDARVGGRS
jgi:quercetin dioxygenase-like cupin family protein